MRPLPRLARSSVTAELGAPAYVVLGMVRLGARSGYEIKQLVENSIRFFWTISQAQIYPSLQLLEQAGFVTGRADPQGRRPRRVFDITAAGEAALRDWLAGTPVAGHRSSATTQASCTASSAASRSPVSRHRAATAAHQCWRMS